VCTLLPKLHHNTCTTFPALALVPVGKNAKYILCGRRQNSIQEEIKSRLKSGNACYHSVQNILSFQFAIQKFKNQGNFCLLFCMGVKLGRSH
jgi:hypothetical protein